MENSPIISKKKGSGPVVLPMVLFTLLFSLHPILSALIEYKNYPYGDKSFFDHLFPSLITYLVFCIIFDTIAVVDICRSRKELLVIDGNKVTLTTKRGITTTYDIRDLFSATIRGSGLMLDGRGLKYTITNLENTLQLHKALTDRMLAVRPVPVQGQPAPPMPVSAPRPQNYRPPYAPVYPSPAIPPVVPAAQPSPASNAANEADAIRRYKSLLDQGLITQEEYDAKKRQILGL